MSISRIILKKWYKHQQNQQNKKFDSHWYIRFGWLGEPLHNQDQLKDLFEIHSPKKFTFADCFYVENQGRQKTMDVTLFFLKKSMTNILLAFYRF